MSIKNLDRLFRPKSIAVIGASNRAFSVGSVVMRNLLKAKFFGPIMPVHPRHKAVAGVWTYPSVGALPATPDLAVICSPPETVPGYMRQLGERGTKAAIILSPRFSGDDPTTCAGLREEIRAAAAEHSMRFLGPDCLGVMIPQMGLNAGFAHTDISAGRIAFISQSDALSSAVMDWANQNNIGFSHFICLGEGLDVDFGDILDYLGGDPGTRSVLLYVEHIGDARKFMSAARAASRNKPVLVIKSGREKEGALAAACHTGALTGSDDVYDCAFRRAGMLRVTEIDSLFDAARTLASAKPQAGDRLAILSNGGGPGILATDKLVSAGGRMAELSPETLRALAAVLPPNWSRGNPVDILDYASSDTYADCMRILSADPGVDAILVMHVPTVFASSEDIAGTVVAAATQARKINILTSWLGGAATVEARRIFALGAIPTYETPDKAIRAFMHMVNYRRNQVMLMQPPASAPTEFTPDVERAVAVIRKAQASGRDILSEPESKEVLTAYAIPTIETRLVQSVGEALAAAADLGYPVVLKVVSDDIIHKAKVGGVALNLASPEALHAAFDAMRDQIAADAPDAHVMGYSVQRMIRRQGAHEIIIGMSTDPVFGPVILFGQGGTAVELIGDKAVALPPLNMALAEDLISRTRIAKVLRATSKHHNPADIPAICLSLLQVSQMIVDIPDIVELDINPLFADESGVLAVDANIRIAAPVSTDGAARLSIRPYPRELEEIATLKNGQPVLLRPIRGEDEAAHYEFLSRVAPEDLRFRFFGEVRELSHDQMAHFTQIDYDREMAFIATAPDESGVRRTLGVVRASTDPDNNKAEFAILVRSDLKGLGLGKILFRKLISHFRERGTREMIGQALLENKAMVGLAKSVGFTAKRGIDNEAYEFSLLLNP